MEVNDNMAYDAMEKHTAATSIIGLCDTESSFQKHNNNLGSSKGIKNLTSKPQIIRFTNKKVRKWKSAKSDFKTNLNKQTKAI